MKWFKRTLLTIPFAVAALLNILSVAAVQLRLNSERIGSHIFLFAAPWSWLLDLFWMPDRHHLRLQMFFGYAILLWVPALLYSMCIWLLFVGFAKMKRVVSPATTVEK
jgi:hypothetical protein